jgi:hypothetical protein
MKMKIYFYWMGVYWSCAKEVWDKILLAIEQDKGFDMDNCRELKGKPKGNILLLKDANPRVDER